MSTIEHDVAVMDLLRSTLAAHTSLFLATQSSSGPWVNGTYFAEQDAFTLALVLEKRGRTLAAIRKDPRAAVIVSSGAPADPFLQAQVEAEVLADDAALEAREVLLSKVPAVEPFLHAPIETVALRVKQWRVTDVQNGWLPGREISAP